mmetsp:Transcript_16114/g.34835  ORF Transcript_16114/g.34835 Transcript_16114/m.34835 type:complete len:410 (+) Transcript_16114:210-1439(+)
MGGEGGVHDVQYSFERSRIWAIKTRLQHTGWLQFAPPLVAGLLGSIISSTLLHKEKYGDGRLYFVLQFVGKIVDLIGGLLLFIGLIDIMIIKFHLWPFAERLPTRQKHRIDPFHLMRHRRSCRSFQTRSLEDVDRNELLKCVRAEVQDQQQQRFGAQPIRLEYIRTPYIRVWPIVNACEFLIAVGPAKYDMGCVIDVGRVLQGVVLRATEMGLGTCWIGPGADQASVVKALVAEGKFDSEADHIIVVCAVGYPSTFLPLVLRIVRTLNNRLPLEKLFFDDSSFGRPLDLTNAPFDRFARCCEAVRWSPSSFNAQPVRCIGVTKAGVGGGAQIVQFDFYLTTASQYYAPLALGIWLRQWEIGCQESVKGRFDILTEDERITRGSRDRVTALPKLPRYVVSWVMDEDAKTK